MEVDSRAGQLWGDGANLGADIGWRAAGSRTEAGLPHDDGRPGSAHCGGGATTW